MNDFDPEQALARWIALEKDRSNSFRTYKATVDTQEITPEAKLRLLQIWMTGVNEAQKEERTLLLKQFYTVGLSLQKRGSDWNLIPMPDGIDALWKEKEGESLEEK
jgi:hypothetical protein